MQRPFIHENFLLQSRRAVELYHGYVADLPIIDYHNHLPPEQIAEDVRFANLTRIWLQGDHYKWRAMRTNGVPERYCTGDATDWEKFEKWAETVPATVRNPLYHWTHLELNRPFGIRDRLLSPATARGIWEECNALLARPEFSARGILRQMNVVALCTTDDPAADLAAHRRLAADASFETRVYPTFRPDGAMNTEDPAAWNAWVDRLAARAGVEIRGWTDLIEALRRRRDDFHAIGGRLADHGVDAPLAEDFTEAEAAATCAALRAGRTPEPEAARRYRTALLTACGRLYAERGWTMQLHIGALRNNNTRAFRALGRDTGHDSIADFEIARPLSRFLDRLDREERLPKTILYNLNPRDNELMVAMAGNFQDGSVPGKIQYGSAWWFLDTKDGMERQLDALSNLGLLSRFVGMLTDSRSFLSFTRHEYFRRILCNRLGGDMEAGLIPDDVEWIGAMARDICFFNAARYFGLALPERAAALAGAARDVGEKRGTRG